MRILTPALFDGETLKNRASQIPISARINIGPKKDSFLVLKNEEKKKSSENGVILKIKKNKSLKKYSQHENF